ncbi:MAG: hypothetical protein WCI72_05855 [archaeon]
MISYSIIGLSLVIIAWLVQLLTMDKTKRVNRYFVIIYALGVLILVYDGFNTGLINLAIANLISLVVSILVLIRVMKK